MSVDMRLKGKYRNGKTYKNVGSQNHNGNVRRKRRSVDMRKFTGTGRDWYR